MTETTYWDHKANLDRLFGDLEHEARMNILIKEQEMKFFEMLHPTICKDGDSWCVLYGKDIQSGICGFGDSPMLAILDFNKSFNATIHPY